MQESENLEKIWKTDPRWKGIHRPYSAKQVLKLRGSLLIEHTLSKKGAERLWKRLQIDKPLSALGCLTGCQAVQAVQAGLEAIYCSGWQVAADANEQGMYPDQSLYAVNSVPQLVKKINQSLRRTDQIYWMKGKRDIDWYVPIIADCEAGFGGMLNAYELTSKLIEAGAACVHFEDQLSSAKKCGHMGGKVLVPTQDAIKNLIAARLAADVAGVPLVIIARTDALSANLLTSDIDPRDKKFIIPGKRTSEGFYPVKCGIDQAIDRALSYAPYADILWCETSTPDMDEAKKFAEAVKAKFPNKILAYNCSPSFNWKAHLTEEQMKKFREELFKMGYRYQFITLAGWHSLNYGMFKLSKDYLKDGMFAYSKLQNAEFDAEKDGYRATKHQQFVGTGYFDEIQSVITGGNASTCALTGSTEEQQFHQVSNGDK